MVYKLWAFEELLTSSDLNSYLMKQAVIGCTSGTRPSSPTTGMTIYETDTGEIRVYSGSAWVSAGSNKVNSYTPVLTAATTNPTLGTGSVALGWWTRSQANLIDYSWYIQFGTTGAAAGSGQYLISLPVAALGVFGSAAPEVIGSGLVRDNSAVDVRQATWYVPGSNLSVVVGFASNAVITHSTPWTWAASDYLAGSIRYRAAS